MPQKRLTTKTYNRLWVANKRLKQREAKLRELIRKAWKLLGSNTKSSLK